MSSLILPPGFERDQPSAPVEERKKVTRAGGVEINSPERPAGNFGSGDEIEIMPSERTKVQQIMTQIQRKYMKSKDASELDMELMEDDIRNGMTKIGLIVDIGWEPVAHVSGQVAYSPVVEFIGRMEEEFDHDQMGWEVKHGLDDGVAGVMTMDGKLVEPKKVF